MVTFTLILCAAAAAFDVLATFYIVHRMLVSATLLCATSFVGVLIVDYISLYDLLRTTGVVEVTTVHEYIYVISSSLASILSCYVVLHLGTNFYRKYNFTKNLLLFAPISLTLGALGVSTYTVVCMVLDDTMEPNSIYYHIATYLSSGSGALALVYAAYPLRSLRKNKLLRAEQTALSVLRLLTVVLFFAAHYAVVTVLVLERPFMDRDFGAIDHVLLVLVFLVCLIPFPRGIVKRVKRKMLGVEELSIGGDFRPSMIAEQIHTPHVVIDATDTSDDCDTSDGSDSSDTIAEVDNTAIIEISAPITAEIRPPKARWTTQQLERGGTNGNYSWMAGSYTPESSRNTLQY